MVWANPPVFSKPLKLVKTDIMRINKPPPFFGSQELGGGVDNGKPLIGDPVCTLAIFLCVMLHMHFRFAIELSMHVVGTGRTKKYTKTSTRISSIFV